MTAVFYSAGISVVRREGWLLSVRFSYLEKRLHSDICQLIIDLSIRLAFAEKLFLSSLNNAINNDATDYGHIVDL